MMRRELRTRQQRDDDEREEQAMLHRNGNVLIECLTRLLAPAESILGTVQREHAHLMLLGVARRIAGDDDVVADLQRVSGDTGVTELACASPFERVADDRGVLL